MGCPDPSARLLTKNLKGNPVRAVIFETQNGVFKFDQKEVKEIICCNRCNHILAVFNAVPKKEVDNVSFLGKHVPKLDERWIVKIEGKEFVRFQ
jgi:hypothetical protein